MLTSSEKQIALKRIYAAIPRADDPQNAQILITIAKILYKTTAKEATDLADAIDYIERHWFREEF